MTAGAVAAALAPARAAPGRARATAPSGCQIVARGGRAAGARRSRSSPPGSDVTGAYLGDARLDRWPPRPGSRGVAAAPARAARRRASDAPPLRALAARDDRADRSRSRALAVLQNVDVILARHALADDPAGAYAAATVAAKALVWVAVGVGLWVLPGGRPARRRRRRRARPVLLRALAVVGAVALRPCPCSRSRRSSCCGSPSARSTRRAPTSCSLLGVAYGLLARRLPGGPVPARRRRARLPVVLARRGASPSRCCCCSRTTSRRSRRSSPACWRASPRHCCSWRCGQHEAGQQQRHEADRGHLPRPVDRGVDGPGGHPAERGRRRRAAARSRARPRARPRRPAREREQAERARARPASRSAASARRARPRRPSARAATRPPKAPEPAPITGWSAQVAQRDVPVLVAVALRAGQPAARWRRTRGRRCGRPGRRRATGRRAGDTRRPRRRRDQPRPRQRTGSVAGRRARRAGAGRAPRRRPTADDHGEQEPRPAPSRGARRGPSRRAASAATTRCRGAGRRDRRATRAARATAARAGARRGPPPRASSAPREKAERSRPAPSSGAAAAAAARAPRGRVRVARQAGAQHEPDRRQRAHRVPVAQRLLQPAAGALIERSSVTSHGASALRQPLEPIDDAAAAGEHRLDEPGGVGRAQQRVRGEQRAEVQREPLRRRRTRRPEQRRPRERGEREARAARRGRPARAAPGGRAGAARRGDGQPRRRAARRRSPPAAAAARGSRRRRSQQDGRRAAAGRARRARRRMGPAPYGSTAAAHRAPPAHPRPRPPPRRASCSRRSPSPSRSSSARAGRRRTRRSTCTSTRSGSSPTSASLWSPTADLGHVHGGQYSGLPVPDGAVLRARRPRRAARRGSSTGSGSARCSPSRRGASCGWSTRCVADARRAGAARRRRARRCSTRTSSSSRNRTSITLLAYAPLPWLLLAVHRGRARTRALVVAGGRRAHRSAPPAAASTSAVHRLAAARPGGAAGLRAG